MQPCRDPNQPLNSILESIGCTPMLKLGRSLPKDHADIFAKIEFFNPGGSLKDRVALAMIESCEAKGELRPGSLIVTASSGNTAIGLALVCAIKKYRLILVMPRSYSPEYRRALVEYGVELQLTPDEEGMEGALEAARKRVAENSGAVLLDQLATDVNPQVHREQTAREILEDLNGETLDALVVGTGSGGSLTGVGQRLREAYPKLSIYGVEFPNTWMLRRRGNMTSPKSNRSLSKVIDSDLVHEVLFISDEQAYEYSKKLARDEGLMIGFQSGAAFCGALEVARRLGAGKKVVTIFPDAGGRYFSLDKYFSVIPSP